MRIKRWVALLVLIVVSFLLPGPISGQSTENRQISLTFERLPLMQPAGFWRPREVSNLILRSLGPEKIVAAGFVIEEKIDDDPSSYIVLKDWIEAGHLLGSNTYSYVDLNQLDAADFIPHVADGQRYLRKVSWTSRFNFRYLRFPLLHQGDTERKKNRVVEALRNGGYTIAPVSVRTRDFEFNSFYVDNEQDSEMIEKIKMLYLNHIEDCLNYSETQSVEVFDREIPQILQLHAGIATAVFLDDLVSMLKERGYSFVSLPEALEDPVYETEESYVGPLGLTFIERVAATRELPYDPSACQIDRKIIAEALAGQ